MVRAKKHLGQHFLRDENIAKKITDGLTLSGYQNLMEIGPGTGVLTKYLLAKKLTLKAFELDPESVVYLHQHYPALNIIEGDFLKQDLTQHFSEPFAVIGNFPYNISSQILFKVLDYRNQIPEVVGMFQKEVAERIAEGPGSKTYGIISVLLQAYYDIEYLFTVDEHVFDPPPKVKSGVIRLTRNKRESLPCDEKLFTQVVKMSFNQRRKMLRVSLRQLIGDTTLDADLMQKRPEQLSVQSFIELTQTLEG